MKKQQIENWDNADKKALQFYLKQMFTNYFYIIFGNDHIQAKTSQPLVLLELACTMSDREVDIVIQMLRCRVESCRNTWQRSTCSFFSHNRYDAPLVSFRTQPVRTGGTGQLGRCVPYILSLRCMSSVHPCISKALDSSVF